MFSLPSASETTPTCLIWWITVNIGRTLVFSPPQQSTNLYTLVIKLHNLGFFYDIQLQQHHMKEDKLFNKDTKLKVYGKGRCCTWTSRNNINAQFFFIFFFYFIPSFSIITVKLSCKIPARFNNIQRQEMVTRFPKVSSKQTTCTCGRCTLLSDQFKTFLHQCWDTELMIKHQAYIKLNHSCSFSKKRFKKNALIISGI